MDRPLLTSLVHDLLQVALHVARAAASSPLTDEEELMVEMLHEATRLTVQVDDTLSESRRDALSGSPPLTGHLPPEMIWPEERVACRLAAARAALLRAPRLVVTSERPDYFRLMD